MKIGDYYNDGHIKGVVINVDSSGNHGLIWSLQRHYCQWYDGTKDVHTGARHPLDGRINQNMVLKNFSKWDYPAFRWCESLGEGWYLPAIGELQHLRNNSYLSAIENTLKKYGGDPLYDGRFIADLYLSSTEGDSYPHMVTYATDITMVQVFCVSAQGGSISSDTKRSAFEYARAVHRF